MKSRLVCRVGGHSPHRRPQGRFLWSAAIGCCLAGVLSWPSARSLAADPAALVQAQLAAGEFGPALSVAQHVADPTTRDALLGEIAVAQRIGGAANAAAATLGNIQNDVARTAAVNQFLAQQIAAPNPILAQAVGGGVGGGGLGGAGGGAGGAGGAAGTNGVDFGPIIDLMQNTIEPATWDAQGGPGAVRPFPGGVLVDTDGLLHRIVQDETSGQLEAVRRQAAAAGKSGDVRAASKLRKVSLTRLERAIQVLRASGHDPDEAMRMLAGLQRIQYVLVYPETGDLVIAGPAGDWRRAGEGRVVSVDNGHPVLQLDDLVVILRHALREHQAPFGCSIDPQQENLAGTQAYLNDSAKHPLREGKEAVEEYVSAIRHHMGNAKIDVFGIDPRTRVGRVLVEADYRMKLVGLGLEKGAGDLRSYLDMLRAQGNNAPQALGLVRWWFALNYDAVQATAERTAFALRGQGVKLQSENEMLADQGKRVQTGQADEVNRKFAESFTRNFPALAEKYPAYAELQNVFDLALAASLITTEDLPGKIGWHISGLRDESQYQVALSDAPTMVQCVAGFRRFADGRTMRVIVQASGGVEVDTQRLVAPDRIQTVKAGTLTTQQSQSPPAAASGGSWWWD